jgi:hypothetical protein
MAIFEADRVRQVSLLTKQSADSATGQTRP